MNHITDPVTEAGLKGAYDNERWGPPRLNERYSRVRNREQYRRNLEESNIGKDVNPALGRRFHKVYKEVKKDN